MCTIRRGASVTACDNTRRAPGSESLAQTFLMRLLIRRDTDMGATSVQNHATHAHEIEVLGQNEPIDVGNAHELESLLRPERPDGASQGANRLQVLRKLQ